MSIARTSPWFSPRSWILPGVFVAAMAILATLPLYGSSYLVILMISILMYVVLTVSWVIFSGSTGYISLAAAAFFGIGIYAAAIFGKEYPFSVIIVIASLLGFVFALLIGAITLRLRGIYFTIFTFGLVLFIQ